MRDLGLAEDLAQEALVAALEQWPESGVRDNPGAWLMGTAKPGRSTYRRLSPTAPPGVVPALPTPPEPQRRGGPLARRHGLIARRFLGHGVLRPEPPTVRSHGSFRSFVFIARRRRPQPVAGRHDTARLAALSFGAIYGVVTITGLVDGKDVLGPTADGTV